MNSNKTDILSIFKSLLSWILIICFLVFIYQISSLYKYREENIQLKNLVDRYSKLEKDIADYEKMKNYYVLIGNGDGSLKYLEGKINDLQEEKNSLEIKIKDMDKKIKTIS